MTTSNHHSKDMTLISQKVALCKTCLSPRKRGSQKRVESLDHGTWMDTGARNVGVAPRRNGRTPTIGREWSWDCFSRAFIRVSVRLFARRFLGGLFEAAGSRNQPIHPSVRPSVPPSIPSVRPSIRPCIHASIQSMQLNPIRPSAVQCIYQSTKQNHVSDIPPKQVPPLLRVL